MTRFNPHARFGLMTGLITVMGLSAGCATVPTTAAVETPVAAAPQTATQAELNRLGETLGYEFVIADNRPGAPCGDGACFRADLKLTLPADLPASLTSGWSTYISLVTTLKSVESDAFDLTLINGDLYRLTPKAGFKLEAGKAYTVTIYGNGHFYSRYYPMPNAYVAIDGLRAKTIAATLAKVDPDTKIEYLPFVPAMTDEAKLVRQSDGDLTQWLTPERAFAQNAERNAISLKPKTVILPTPAKITPLTGAALDLSSGVTVQLDGVAPEAVQTALDYLSKAGVGGFASGPALTVTVDPKAKIAPEGYRLKTNGKKGISIVASDAAGASNGLRSLAQQVAFENGKLSPVAIEDAPRLSFRGLHVDVARNFHSKQFVLDVIEQMAVYKLNRLHLHLGEDEGWRLEIDGLPELTSVGGYRCHDPKEDTCLLPQLGAGPDRDTPVNGYFTKADYIEILKAAKARHIEVLPSFDMPGHSRAAVRSMEARYRRLTAEGKTEEAAQYRLVEPTDTTEYRSIQNYNDNTLNVCLPATYRFIDKVIDETAKMHAEAGTPLKRYHIGADETAGAWSGSPACQAMMKETGLTVKQLGGYFIERVSNDLDKKGIVPAGWSDGMGHTDPAKMPKVAQSNIWGGLFAAGVAEGHDHLNRGWDIVISMPEVTYFDIPYAPHPDERGYDWPSRNTDSFKVFSFLPENLPANAVTLKTLQSNEAKIEDKTPVQKGRSLTGLQAQVWSETIRSDDMVEYMLFPRLLALSERAWHEASWEPAYVPGKAYSYGDGSVNKDALLRDWAGFRARTGVHLRWLDRDGITYRLAPPGGRIVNGQLEANAEFASTLIEYRTSGGQWQAYAAPVAVSGPVELRVKSPDGTRASRIVTVGQ